MEKIQWCMEYVTHHRSIKSCYHGIGLFTVALCHFAPYHYITLYIVYM
jgi:hypothetical protein